MLFRSNRARLLMNMPVINKRIKEKVREFVLRKFGNRPYEVVVGGAPLNKEIENFFISVGFPIAMGYGTTETAPLITFAHQAPDQHGGEGSREEQEEAVS